MQRLVAGTTLAALLVVGAAGCGADTDPLPPVTDAAVIGTYSLFEVNGGGLPFLAAANNVTRFEFTSGSVTIRADGTIEDILNYRTSRVDGTGTPETGSDIRTGTWTRDGGVVMATYDGITEVQPLAYVDNRLTRNDGPFVYSYRK